MTLARLTSRRLPAAHLLLCLALAAGCAQIGPTAPPVDRLAVRDGAVEVQGPDGYCVDPRGSQPRAGFVVLAGCAAISSRAVEPPLPGLLTVQVGEAGSAMVAGNEAALLSLLTSEDGQAMLAQDGDAASVDILSHRRRTGVVAIAFEDRSAGEAPGLMPGEWRAFLDLRGRLVTLSVRRLATRPLTQTGGRALLDAAVAAVIAANAPQDDAKS